MSNSRVRRKNTAFRKARLIDEGGRYMQASKYRGRRVYRQVPMLLPSLPFWRRWWLDVVAFWHLVRDAFLDGYYGRPR